MNLAAEIRLPKYKKTRQCFCRSADGFFVLQRMEMLCSCAYPKDVCTLWATISLSSAL